MEGTAFGICSVAFQPGFEHPLIRALRSQLASFSWWGPDTEHSMETVAQLRKACGR